MDLVVAQSIAAAEQLLLLFGELGGRLHVLDAD